MTFKQGTRVYLLLLIFTFSWNQQTSFLTQKTSLENSYHDKVVATLSRLVGRESFIAIINVEFSNSNKTNINNKSNPALKNDEVKNGYAPIPGLPTVPYQNNTSNSSKHRKSSNNDYYVSKILVNIELDENLASELIENEMRSLIKKAIPEITDCENCIIIDTIQFLPSEQSSLEKQLVKLQETVDALQLTNELLETEKRNAKLDAEEKKYEEAQKKLIETLEIEEKKYEEIQKQLDELQKLEQERIRLEREKKDAELLKLQEEKRLRTEQIIRDKEATEKKVEKIMNSKIRSDSLIISEAMDMYKSVMKQKGGGDFDNESLLGMQIGNSGPGMINAIIFLLLILFIIVLLFIALNKKNRPVYLKPKTKKKSLKKEMNTESEKVEPISETENTYQVQQNDDSIRSELKSLRQTAVSLTVGEKETASNLIKEWLDDNPNKETISE